MSKQEIVQRLTENYKQRISDHLKQMEQQGYVLADDKALETVYLMRFNAHRFKFEIVASAGEVYKHIDFSKVSNPFKIVLKNYDYLDIVMDSFKLLDCDDLYAFEQYEENIEHIIPEKEMQADLKSYLKLSEKLAGDLSKGMQDTPQTQAKILAGANIFYTGRDNSLSITECNKYYQWNKKTDKFQLLTAEHINRILSDAGMEQHRNLEIETNMRTVYPVTVTNTSFPVIWNKQKDLQHKLKREKKGHDKIAKIVAKYE